MVEVEAIAFEAQSPKAVSSEYFEHAERIGEFLPIQHVEQRQKKDMAQVED